MTKKGWRYAVISICAGLLLIGGVYIVTNRTTQLTNRLGDEKSPYLLQHASNPIWWQPWGDDALTLAKKHDRPIFLSIGYSTCYWCHFMEEDSFEKQDVADLLNASFISIKVDREEYPEVDKRYMSALVASQGQGGWPLSGFLLPDGTPFFMASTIPHDKFITLLKRVADAWEQDREGLKKTGEQFSRVLSELLDTPVQKQDIDDAVFDQFFKSTQREYDTRYGGYGQGQKFPRPYLFRQLLREYHRMGNKEALNQVVHSLDVMIRGGFHDWVGGGFHRYTVDREWKVPHFEKMLYDNADLVKTLVEAYQITKNPAYKTVVGWTLDWLAKEMTHPKGGFYAALDAGKYEKEGEFYVWDYEELKTLLGDDLEAHQQVFEISKQGNFEGKTVFYMPPEQEWTLDQTLFMESRERLAKARSKRTRPHTDDKVIVAWNGLMIGALSKAYQVFGDDNYLHAAQKAAAFIRTELWDPKQGLKRYWRDGGSKNPGVLDDYAFLIDGLLELFQADSDPTWFNWAQEVQSVQDRLFWSDKEEVYYYSDRDRPIKIKDFEDSALPSGISMSAFNLLRFSSFTTDAATRERALTILKNMMSKMTRAPMYYPNMLMAMDYAQARPKEVIVLESPTNLETMVAINSEFQPNKVQLFYNPEKNPATNMGAIPFLKGKTVSNKDGPTFFICEQGRCQLPTTDLQKAMALILKK